MTCPTYVRLLSRWLDGEVTASERAVAESHLATCEECRKALVSWRLQGAHLRSFLCRHSLGEEFIDKVRAARGRKATSVAVSTAERGWSGKDLFSWLQAAAGLILVILLLVHLIPSADGQYLARVVQEGVETRSSETFTWSRTSIGTVLHGGDWVRNYEPGNPQLLLNDSSRITLGRGALARLGGAPESGPHQITVVQGSILSEVQPDARGVQINLPRGDVIGLGGRFSTLVRNVALPRLELGVDATVVLSGSVQAVSEVRVHEGAVRVSAGSFHRDVAAGKAVSLAPSLVAQEDDSGSGDVRTSLSIDGGSASASGNLLSSLAETSGGLRLRMEVRQLPLVRLMEWTTDTLVRGDEKIRVSGWIEYAPGLRQDVLVQAIGESLGLHISIRRDVVPREVVTLPDASDAVPTGAGAREFTVRKSASGSVSFDFRSVPAGEVFRALRGEVALPCLASESASSPVTLHAESLKLEDVRTWLENQLRWTVRESRHLAEIVDIASTVPSEKGPDSGASPKGGAAARSEASAADPAGEISGADSGSRQKAAASSSPSLFQIAGLPSKHLSFSTGVRSPAAVQPHSVDLNVRLGSNGVTATARISTKSARYPDQLTSQKGLAQRSRHLVWPALAVSADVLTDAYILHNPSRVTAHTLWHGYDSAGHLMAWHELELAPGESMTVSPIRDLIAVLDEGGHWETVSDTPLTSGSGEASATPGSAGFYAESLPALWEFDTAAISGMGGDSRLWMINPGDSAARAILAVVGQARILFSQEILMAPHGGFVWAVEELLPSYPELARLEPASSILIQLTEGSLVAGTRVCRRNEDRELVFDSTPNR